VRGTKARRQRKAAAAISKALERLGQEGMNRRNLNAARRAMTLSPQSAKYKP